MKDVLGRKIMTESAALGPKIYNYLKDDSNENTKKQKAQEGAS